MSENLIKPNILSFCHKYFVFLSFHAHIFFDEYEYDYDYFFEKNDEYDYEYVKKKVIDYIID